VKAAAARNAIAVGAFVLVAAATAVTAQQPSAAGLLEATYGVEVTVPVSALEERYEESSAEVPAVGASVPLGTACGTDQFSFNATGGWFRFREDQYEAGCGEVRYAVDVPAGARSAVVSFRADRAIQQASTFPLPIAMEQELRVYDSLDGLLATFPYYESNTPQRLESEPFSFPIDLTPAQGRLSVGWLFRDRGQPFSYPVAGQGFSATVQEPRITFDGIPMDLGRPENERLGLQGDSVRFATTIVAPVPDSLGVSGRISVTMRVADELVFSHAFGPRGQVVPESFLEVTELGDVRTVVLTGDATAAYGAGAYRLVFTTSTPISPSPLLYPFIALVMTVPFGAGVLAWRNTRKFRQQATPEFVATASNLENVVLAMIAVYLLLPLGVLISGRLSLLASWPLEGEAGLVYLLIGIAFVAFLAVGVVGRRHLNHVMLEEASIKDQARRELERSNRELAEFAYVASHDLQEPLRTVASYTQLLQRRYKGKLDPDADEFIDSAVEGAQRMQNLIQDLLQYSRVGSKPEAHASVDLGGLVEDVKRTLRQAITEAGAEVVVPKPLPTIVAHERQFEQLLQNLIGNAVKFRDPARPCRVEVTAEPVPAGWRLAVRDNGIGIDPNHFGRIFQIFQRLHGRDEYPGTGIGLAICKRIVELNGGKIGVESKPGQGSTFWFTVPDRPAPVGAADPADSADSAAAAATGA
jgi:signal transduction histidine kinase